MILEKLSHLNAEDGFDVCVVGAGPVGLALALRVAQAGLKVLLLESGPSLGELPASSLNSNHEFDVERHADMAVASCRGLGGTSRWWGGRCVAFDDIDFVRPGWLFSHEEVGQFYDEAAVFFGISSGSFSEPLRSWPKLRNSRVDLIERWTPEIDMSVRHGNQLRQHANLTVVCNTTVVSIDTESECSDGRRASLTAVSDGGVKRISCDQLVLAAGGLETTRLLKASSVLLGLKAAHFVGKGYMGHISGKIADIVFNSADDSNNFDFYLDGSSFGRRRFALTEDAIIRNELLNLSFWIDNPPFSNPGHRSGILSMVWLALALPWIGRRLVSEGVRLSHVGPRPYSWWPHLRNAVFSPFSTAKEILNILTVRYLKKPPKPGFIVRSHSGRYALHFHSEQSSGDESCINLNGYVDSFGVRCMKIDLKFSEADAIKIVRSHALLDEDLRAIGKGRLEFYDKNFDDRVRRVMGGASDGFHQIGTTRMGADPESSVVDGNCRVHGVKNLFIASSSVFPSSGQANPTFPATALALRLADHLVSLHKNKFASSKG